MAKRKVCKDCKLIYEGDKCPNCGSQEYTEEIKGKVAVLDPEKSLLAKKMGKKGKGVYSIKS